MKKCFLFLAFLACIPAGLAASAPHTLVEEGYKYYMGVDRARNVDKALELWGEAADAGNISGTQNLLRHYYAEKRNLEAAIPLAVQLADRGDVDASNLLGGIKLVEGKPLGIAGELPRLTRWLQQGAERGNKSSMELLRRLYISEGSFLSGKEFFISLTAKIPESQEALFSAAIFKLGASDSDEYWDGIAALQELSDRDNQSAMAFLAYLFSSSLSDGVQVGEGFFIPAAQPDPEITRKWLTRLDQLENQEGQVFIGILHLYGLSGYRRDLSLAQKYFRRAEKNGSTAGFSEYAELWNEYVKIGYGEPLNCELAKANFSKFPACASFAVFFGCEGGSAQERINLLKGIAKQGNTIVALRLSEFFLESQDPYWAQTTLVYADPKYCRQKLTPAEIHIGEFICQDSPELVKKMRRTASSQISAMKNLQTNNADTSGSSSYRMKKPSAEVVTNDAIKKIAGSLLNILGMTIEAALAGAMQGLSDAVVVYAVSEATGQQPNRVYSQLRTSGTLENPAREKFSSSKCACTCVEGTYQPLCTGYSAVKPICGYRVCPVVPYSPRPASRAAPIEGTQQCQLEQVYEPSAKKYGWKTVCR